MAPAPRKAFDFRQVTPTPAPFSRRGAVQVGAWLLAKPLSSVGSHQHRRLGPGRRGARRRRNKGLQGAAHHVRTVAGALAPEDVVLGDEGIRVAGSGAPRLARHRRHGPGRRGARRRRNKGLRGATHHVRLVGPRRALFAVMLFINLQKRYNEVARLARGRFGRRKGTRSKQFITGG